MDRKLDYASILNKITIGVKTYLLKHNIQSLIMGVSGGLDSGVNCAILAPICKELGIPLIGRYIHIETNREEEKQRAELIGNLYCDDFKSIDLTELYLASLNSFEEDEPCDVTVFSEKIRRGNIKARLRMIHLYNLAGKKKGIVVDNDNMTEYLLGFYTIGGDIGDITPLADLYKTEVFELTKFIKDNSTDENEKHALQLLIDAVPTDGLGITSSDVEQFGANSYDEVDDILFRRLQVEKEIESFGKNHMGKGNDYKFVMDNSAKLMAIHSEYGDIHDKVWNRHINSGFKRNHPFKIHIL